MKRFTVVLLSLLVIVLLSSLAVTGCNGEADTEEPTSLIFWSASPGGSWYPIAVAVGQIWEDHANVVITHEPGGGEANVTALGTNLGDIGMTFSVSTGDAAMGLPPFEEKFENLRSLCLFYPNYFCFLTFEDSGINSIADFEGQSIGVGKKGYGTNSFCETMFGLYDLTYDDMQADWIDDEDAVLALQDGHVAAIVTGMAPTGEPNIIDLASTRPISVLPLSDSDFAQLKAAHPGYILGSIPGGVYNGIDQPVPAAATAFGLIISADVPDDVAYLLAKTLAEHWKTDMWPIMSDLQTEPASLATELGVPIHPGALRYYEEMGYVD